MLYNKSISDWIYSQGKPESDFVGHSLFALLSGLIGTVVGKIFYARRNRSEEVRAQTP